jgi:hypothetical protein
MVKNSKIFDVSRDFSHSCSVQTGSGARTGSYLVTPRDFFPGIMRTGLEAIHSPPAIIKAKKRVEIGYAFTFPNVLTS